MTRSFLKLNFEQINIRGLKDEERFLGNHFRDFRTDIVLMTELQPKGFRFSQRTFSITGWDFYMESLRCAVLVNNTISCKVEHVKLGIDRIALAKADFERHPYATAVRLTDPISKKSLLVVCTCLPLPEEGRDIRHLRSS